MKKKTISAKEYSEKMGFSKTWACQLLRRMHKYNEPAPKVDRVEMVGNQYVVTVKG